MFTYEILNDVTDLLKFSFYLDLIFIVDLTDEKIFKKYTKIVYFDNGYFTWIVSEFKFVNSVKNHALGVDFKLVLDLSEISEEELFYFKLKYDFLNKKEDNK